MPVQTVRAMGFCVINAVFVVSLFPSAIYTASDWCYKDAHCGPSNWTNIAATCGGSRQSPIDIDSMKASYDDSLTEIRLVNFNKTDGSASAVIKNNGHTVVVELPNSDYVVEGGGLLKSKLVQFHLHWGSTDDVGSEHTVDSKAFPMEVHFVTYAEKYADFSTAVANEDGLSVLGFFFEVGPTGNQKWADIVALLDDIRYSGENVTKPTFRPVDLVPSSRRAYFRYKGSLTTPKCNEVVTWTVFKEPIMITADVMTGFRRVFSNEEGAGTNSTMSDNYRPVQPLGSRKVTTSISSGHALSFTSVVFITILLSLTTSVRS